MTADPLANVFAAPKVMRLCSPRSYQHGVSYHLDEKLEPAGTLGPGIEVTVRGTLPYVVRLWTDDGKPVWPPTASIWTGVRRGWRPGATTIRIITTHSNGFARRWWAGPSASATPTPSSTRSSRFAAVGVSTPEI